MSKRNSFKKDSIKRNERISGVLQKQPSFNSHQKLFFHTKQPYYTLQDKANPDAPPTYQIYRGPSQPLTSQTLTSQTLNNLSSALANNVNLPSTNSVTNTTLSSPPLQSQRPKNILSELVVSTGDELVFQTKKSDIENALKLIKSIEDRFMEDHLQQDKIFLSRINSYTNGYIPLLHLTAYADISKYSQNNLEYMAHAIETYSNHLELNPERTHVKRKGQGTVVPLEELIENLVPVAKRTLVALNIDSTQVQKQQEVLNQCRHYIKEMEEKEEEEEKKRNDISSSQDINTKDSQITSILMPHSVRIAYIEDPRDYRNMFYKPEDLCKDIFEPMDSIAYALIEFDSEKTANYVYSRFKNDRKKNKTNILMKKRFRNFKKFNNNNNNNNNVNSNRSTNNNTNNTTNGIVNKNKYNKTFNNKNYQNSTKKDKNKFHKKSNNHFNVHNSFNNKNTNNNNNNNNFNQINTTIINNNNDNQKSNYRNKNNIYQIDNPKINKFHMDSNNNNRKSYANIIATPPDTEIINNESNTSPPATSPITMNISNTNHHTSLDRPNTNTSMNQIPTFMNPLNTFNNLFPSQTQNQIPTLSNTQTSPQYSNEIASPISLKRNNPNNIMITSSVSNVIDNPPTIHSGNSVNSGINPSIFNSPTFTKENQKQQVFFQNNVQYNGKIYKLDPLTSSGYIQLSDEVISVLLNDTRNEGKSFELIKSYLVYFSYSDVEISHLKNMKIGDTVSFKVKMTFIAPSNTNNSINSSNLSLLDDEDNSITQAFDIFIKNKNNIPPDVLEMMKMMENIF